MILAIGIWDDYSWSMRVNCYDANSIALALYQAPENGCGCWPEQILLVQDDTVIRQFQIGVEYER